MNSLWNYIFNMAMQYPEQTLTEGNKVICYKDFFKTAKNLSMKLRKGCKYGILCESELMGAVSIMACFSAGAIAVPMSVRYGENHRHSVIDSIKLSWIITDTDIQKIGDEIPEEENLENVAAIMCTSGTTGTPKGVMLSDENIISNLKSIKSYFKLCKEDKILIVRPIFHAAALTGEFLTGLISGCGIVFSGNTTLPVTYAKIIASKKITTMCTTPTLLQMLGTFMPRTSMNLLNKIAISGECLTKSSAEKIRKLFPGAELLNVYGLTEASPRVTALLPEYFDFKPCSVGKPIEGVEIKIDNGELCVKGKNVMKGYYLNPKETDKKIKDGWLYTGDIAEIRDGFLYIKGRKDDMIIRAGMNIYPQQIENAVLVSDKTEEALAVECDGRIVLKIVGRITSGEVFELCKTNLPTYAFPDKIEIVDRLPHSIAGKLVRHG